MIDLVTYLFNFGLETTNHFGLEDLTSLLAYLLTGYFVIWL